ncbi:hypothetical protein [Paraburkholderia hayleyella]|uniref:hypothetical protein n=1 Tax=Paraburkholderia hayleyella TaxID=2152889 RepID=UPI0012921A5C|nr:hypothetical protein [Paraburkholderia hayleyella]
MRHLTFKTYSGEIYRTTWHIIKTMPAFLLTIIVIFAIVDLSSIVLAMVSASENNEIYKAIESARNENWVIQIIDIYVTGIVFIKINRLLFLNEQNKFLDPDGYKALHRYVKLNFLYLLICLVITLGLFIIALLLTGSHLSKPQIYIVSLIAFGCSGYIFIRLALLFPAIALGSNIALRAAWQNSSPHFWNLFRIMAGIIASIILCTLAVFYIFEEIFQKLTPVGQIFASIPVRAIYITLTTVIFSVTAGWLYRHFACELIPLTQSGALQKETT